MISAPFRRPIQGAVAAGDAAAGPWYLAGGIALANCVAAYQPKSAASLAASYVNLANPGTYDAAPGVAPTFDAATGWTFDGSTQYLMTGITPASGWSMLVQTGTVTQDGYLCGEYHAGENVSFAFYTNVANEAYYFSGQFLAKAPAFTSGNLGIAGQTAYRNGSAETGSIPAWGAGSPTTIYIGGIHSATQGLREPFAGPMIALAIYNTTLTAPQMAGVAARMAAL